MRRLFLFCACCASCIWACVEEPTSPAHCPDFCPGTRLAAVESLFPSAVSRDSTFSGYVTSTHAGFLPATAEGGIDSRPITQFTVFAPRTQIDSVDTATGPKVIDSMKLVVRFLRPDPAVTTNLRLSFYQLPDSIDSTTTLAGLAPSFAAAPLRTVNVDSLLGLSARRDAATGDTVLTNGIGDTNSIATGSSARLVVLRLKFDSAHAPFNAADSGRFSLGVVVAADNHPTVFFTSRTSGLALSASWFYRVDSAGKLIRPDSIFYKKTCTGGTCTDTHPPDSVITNANFDNFVYTAPAQPPDSNLLIGGTPSQRSLLRINFPKQIRDSSQVLRAELFLVPTATAPLTLGDSVLVVANRVGVDFGLKSPLVIDAPPDSIQGSSAPFSGNPADTVRIELTHLFRLWQFDTTQTTTLFLRLMSLRRFRSDSAAREDTTGRYSSFEGSTFTTLRFYSSRTAAFRPLLKLTYVPRIKLGVP